MRILSTILISFIFALLVGCSSGGEVSGRSIKSANRSVIRIKNRLPTEQRIEFEVSYWTLRDAIKNREEFLDTVGGNTPDELIVLGKEIFQQRKNAGFKDYDEYNSWDQMIAKFTQDRIDQNKHRKRDPRDAGNNVLYKL
jgi:hypothetical protein